MVEYSEDHVVEENDDYLVYIYMFVFIILLNH